MVDEQRRNLYALSPLSAFADDRYIPVDERMAGVLPSGLKKGGVIRIGGSDGTGLYSCVALTIARATQRGSFVALVNLDDFGYAMLTEVGVDLSRVVVVRDDRQPTTTLGILCESFPVVVATPQCSSAQAQRLLGKVRERGTVFIAVEREVHYGDHRGAVWPLKSEMVIRTDESPWEMCEGRTTLVSQRSRKLTVSHKGYERSILADVS